MRLPLVFVVASLLFLCPFARADEKPSDEQVTDCTVVAQAMASTCSTVAAPMLDPDDDDSIRTAGALCTAAAVWAMNTCNAGAVGTKYPKTCWGVHEFTKDAILAGGEEVAKQVQNEAAAKSISAAADLWAHNAAEKLYTSCLLMPSPDSEDL